MAPHRGRDVTDVGRQPEGQSGSLRAEGGAGDEQQGRLHGRHGGAGVQDAQFAAGPVKSTSDDGYPVTLQEPGPAPNSPHAIGPEAP